MNFNFPMVLADHTPWHSILQFITSPVGIFIAVGAIGIVAFNVLRNRK